MIYIDILDNQKRKAFKKHFPEATIFKVEENSRTFQGFHPKFKDFSRLCKPLKEKKNSLSLIQQTDSSSQKQSFRGFHYSYTETFCKSSKNFLPSTSSSFPGTENGFVLNSFNHFLLFSSDFTKSICWP